MRKSPRNWTRLLSTRKRNPRKKKEQEVNLILELQKEGRERQSANKKEVFHQEHTDKWICQSDDKKAPLLGNETLEKEDVLVRHKGTILLKSKNQDTFLSLHQLVETILLVGGKKRNHLTTIKVTDPSHQGEDLLSMNAMKENHSITIVVTNRSRLEEGHHTNKIDLNSSRNRTEIYQDQVRHRDNHPHKDELSMNEEMTREYPLHDAAPYLQEKEDLSHQSGEIRSTHRLKDRTDLENCRTRRSRDASRK